MMSPEQAKGLLFSGFRADAGCAPQSFRRLQLRAAQIPSTAFLVSETPERETVLATSLPADRGVTIGVGCSR